MIEQHLRPDDVMLEWGAGGSTYRFSRLVAEYFSIEHDRGWYERMKGLLERSGRRNVTLVHVPPDLPIDGVPNARRGSTDRYAQFRGYIEQVDRLGVPRFDRVLIDGRSRPECARRVLPYLGPDSLVFIHDYFNTRYDRSEYDALGDVYETVDAIEKGRSLVVLRPRPGSSAAE